MRRLLQRLCSLGFRGPSCIQSVAWPAVLSGRTVVAVGSPHSGKTLSYLLPLVSRLTSESDYRHLPVSSGVGDPPASSGPSRWTPFGVQRHLVAQKALSPSTNRGQLRSGLSTVAIIY